MNSCFLKLFKTPFGSIALRSYPYFYPRALQGSYKRCLFFTLLVWVTLNGFYYPWPNGLFSNINIMAHQPRSQGFSRLGTHTFISPTYFFSSISDDIFLQFCLSVRRDNAHNWKRNIFSVWYSEVILVSECVNWRKKRVHFCIKGCPF